MIFRCWKRLLISRKRYSVLFHDDFLAVDNVDAAFLRSGHLLAVQGVDYGDIVLQFRQGDV